MNTRPRFRGFFFPPSFNGTFSTANIIVSNNVIALVLGSSSVRAARVEVIFDVVLCQCDCAQLRVRVKTQILRERADCSFLTVRVFENWPRRVTYPSTYRTHISSQIITPQSTSLGGGGGAGDRGEKLRTRLRRQRKRRNPSARNLAASTARMRYCGLAGSSSSSASSLPSRCC